MTQVIKSLKEWQALRSQPSGTVGFVPTMGALHPGHASLMTRAKAENDLCVASIFVNPTQFNNQQDLVNYPVRTEEDLECLNKCGVDYVLCPQYEELYHDQYAHRVSENKFSLLMEGAHRPGHFDGVLTVVLKLFNLVRPHRAYFGEKDYQQLQLIKNMSDALFLGIDVVPCPTIREASGLAMSSRNLRLTPEQREMIAPLFFKRLSTAKSAQDAALLLEQDGFRVDYIEDHGDRRFGAAFLGEIRLIDNVKREIE